MRAAYYEANGLARDVLTVGDLETPEPGPGEVRVRVRVTGVNPSDVKSRMSGPGRPPMAFPLIVPHSDGAGEIDEVGEGVPDSRVGERVWIWNAQWRRPFGTAAEFVVLPGAQAVPLPDGTDFEAGACLGIPALTAYHAVTSDGAVNGDTILVSGGAGCVGHYAIQIAKLKGAGAIATVSSPEKAAHAEAAGADHVIDYRREDVAARVTEITGGRGVDRVIEVDLSGNGPLLPQILRPGGTAVVYGSNRPEVTFPYLPFLIKGVTLRFFIVYELAEDVRRDATAGLDGLLAEKRLQHRIAARFPLADIAAAHEAVEGGRLIGNVVVEVA